MIYGGSVQLSYATSCFVHILLEDVVEKQDLQVEMKRQRTVAIPRKSISESLGAGIGAGVAENMSRNAEIRDFAQQYSPVFLGNYASAIVEALEYAWAVSHEEQGTAQNIVYVVNEVFRAPCLTSDAKSAFQNKIASLLHTVLQAFPDQPNKLDEIPQDKKGCCFVATAVMGDDDHPYVLSLRKYRDERLCETGLGRMFILTYYRLSPSLARWIGKSNRVRAILRVFLIAPLA